MTPEDRAKKNKYRRYLKERGYEMEDAFGSACAILRCALQIKPYPGIEGFYRQQKDGCLATLRAAIQQREHLHSSGGGVP